MIECWCDGSSDGRSGGATGWGYIIVQNNQVLYADYGGDESGTNNLAELEAAIQGLTALKLVVDKHWAQGETIVLVSDSRYTLGMASGRFTPVKNLDKIQQLQDLYKGLCTDNRWVRGHAGDIFNELCDRLAKKGKLEMIEALLSKGAYRP